MIHLITSSHPSSRYPGKNDRLGRFTTDWAAIAAQYCDEPVKFYHAGPYRPIWLPLTWYHVQTDPDDDHLTAIQKAEEGATPQPDDVLVLAQLTQPLRSRWLLDEAVELCRNEKKPVISAVEHKNPSWRLVEKDGSWGSKKTIWKPFHDGRIYAWQPGQLADIFNHSAPHAVLHSGESWCLVDVDIRTDLPPGLESIWAHSLNCVD